MIVWVREVRMEPCIIYANEKINLTCRPLDLPVVVSQLAELPQSWSKATSSIVDVIVPMEYARTF